MYIIAIVVAALVLIADQVAKYLIVANFQLGQSIPLVDGFMNLTYIVNEGAAFGILKGGRWFFLAVTIIIMIICICMLIKKTYDSKLMFWAISLVLSGGLGNLIDRIFRGGRVVDFLDLAFSDFPIFNIADCAVVVGACLIALYFIIDIVTSMKTKSTTADDYARKLADNELMNEANTPASSNVSTTVEETGDDQCKKE